MKLLAKVPGLLLGLACLPALSAGPCPTQVRIGIIDYELAPLVLAVERGAPPEGKLVDWIRMAMGRSACNPGYSFERMPIRRGRVELEQGNIDIWAVSLPNPELHDQGVLPMAKGAPDAGLGFFRTAYSLYVLAGEQRVKWDGRQLVGPADLSIGISPVRAIEDLARERGWPVDRAVDTPNAMNKLLSGRHLAAVLPEAAISSQPPDILKKLQRLEPPVLMAWYYSVASKPFASRYPEFMRGYWLELCRLGRTEAPKGEWPACRES
ncbi:hypothetical protein [Pelomonas sp. SE-A7]|uniref:hypothetical protein n=1 Tax=Pelomonas sp. SE-A7 TaxID=3054953 RepID=UPI00259CBE85|nr:hypothetical protein [Pelomonas sp. SE-A7]MDM4767772.1 hypothetical protein [Pelomonas sp. SE-A7]